MRIIKRGSNNFSLSLHCTSRKFSGKFGSFYRRLRSFLNRSFLGNGKCFPNPSPDHLKVRSKRKSFDILNGHLLGEFGEWGSTMDRSE